MHAQEGGERVSERESAHTQGVKKSPTEHKTMEKKYVMAISVQLTQPEPFDFSSLSDWPRWVRRFERFHVASGLKDQDEEYHVNALLYAMKDAADDIVLRIEEKKKYHTESCNGATLYRQSQCDF